MGGGGSHEVGTTPGDNTNELNIQVEARFLQNVWERKQRQSPPPPTEENLRRARIEEKECVANELLEIHEKQDKLKDQLEDELKGTVASSRQKIYEKLDSVWEADNSLIQYSRELDSKLEKGRVNFNRTICLSEREDVLECLQGGKNIRQCSEKIQAFDQCSHRI